MNHATYSKIQAMKKILLSVFLIGTFISTYGQKEPGWEQAKKDLYNDQVNLDKWFKNFEIGSIEDFEVKQIGEGPYKSYSNHANNSVYKYIYEPDLLTYTFSADAPKNEKGDKYSFTIVVRYTRSDFSGSYGKPLSNYEFFKVNASIRSYDGKDLNSASLQVLLEEFSEKNRSFDVSGKYKLSRIDSLFFERVEGESIPGVQDYYVEVHGDGVHSRGDFEYHEVANIKAYFKMRLRQSKGQWMTVGFSEYQKPDFINVRPGANYPAVYLTRDVGLKATYRQYDVAEVPIESLRNLGDICRLIQTEYVRPREEFERIEIIKKLFNSDEGKKALNDLYRLKAMIKKYSLTVNETGVSDRYGVGVTKDNGNEISISFDLTRKLTKEEWKQTKTEGASKQTAFVTKFPAAGYVYLRLQVKNNGQLYISSSQISNELYYQNGGQRTRHPLD